MTCQQCFLQRLIEILQNVREDLQSIIILRGIRNPALQLERRLKRIVTQSLGSWLKGLRSS